MAYKQLAENQSKYIEAEKNWADGNGSVKNPDLTIDLNQEINNLNNSLSLGCFYPFTLALVDQIAIERSKSELNKKPSDYLSDYSTFLSVRQSELNQSIKEYRNAETIRDIKKETIGNHGLLFSSTVEKLKRFISLKFYA